MIYLFEDRKGRMQQYFQEQLDQAFIRESIIDCSLNKLEPYINAHYSDADCILFHKSYQFPSGDILPDNVKDLFLKKEFPLSISVEG